MRLLIIPLKNITLNKKRTFALFLFMLISTFFLIVFGNFITTINDNMKSAMTDSITGDVQIRPSDTEESEMVSLSENWSMLPIFKEDAKRISESLSDIKYEKRLRGEGTLIKNTEMAVTKIIGCSDKQYQESVSILEGSYLEKGNTNGILLTDASAKTLGAKVDDIITLMYQKDGKSTTVDMKVQGIIEMPLLSMFGIDVAYMNLDTLQNLYGYAEEVCSEIIINSSEKIEELEKTIQMRMNDAGLDSNKVKITNWKQMGGTVLGGIQLYEVMFGCFIVAYLLIIAILVINLIFMMGTERMKDIGTLKAIGFSRAHIIFLFVAEIAIITAVGGLVGSIAGIIVSMILSNTSIVVGAPMNFVLGNKFSLVFNPLYVVPIYLFILVFGCLVAVYPSLKISRRNVVETLIDM